VSIKRKSPAGKLAQAVYDAWMVQQNGCAARPFPKTGFSGDASQWAVIGTAALEHLREEYGIDLELSTALGGQDFSAPIFGETEQNARPDAQGQYTCTKCPRPVRGPGRMCGVHTNLSINEAFGLIPAAPAQSPAEGGPQPASRTVTVRPDPLVLAPNRMAVYCRNCDFYLENWQLYGHSLMVALEQHHRWNGTHVVYVIRNPEETRETVTM
jgi:hypothetical protein